MQVVVLMHGTKARVLVVEDEVSMAQLIGEFFLACNDMEAEIFTEVEAAERAVIEGLQPDVALVDFFLGDGLTAAPLCRLLKAEVPGCVLFVMSGLVTEELAVEAIGFGVDGFFEKPFSFEQLRTRLQRVLGGTDDNPFGFTHYPAPSTTQLERLEALVHQNPDDAGYRRILAFSYYIADRFAEAAAVYATLTVADVTFQAAYYAGHTYARMGKLPKAVEHWSKALELADGPRARLRVEQRMEQARRMA